jgi:hypothetical protein
MAKLVRREVILAKVESTYNTDAAPSGTTDAILVENLSWSNEGLRLAERAAVRPSIGTLQQIYAGSLMQVSFDVELKGSGTAGDAPEIAPLLRACGLAETVVAGTSVSYQPASASQESATIYYYDDGSLRKLTGCRGNVSFSLAVGEVPKATFTLTGHVSDHTDAALPTASYDSTVPAPVLAAPFSVHGYAADITALSVDLGNQIALPASIKSADGYGEILIAGRDVQGSFDPEATSVATHDFIGRLKSGATGALTSGTIGTATGNKFQIDLPKVYYRDVSPGDRDGIRAYDVPFGAAETTTDDEITILFS